MKDCTISFGLQMNGFELKIYPVVLWGRGKTAINLYHYLRHLSVEILGFTDSFVSTQNCLEIDGDRVRLFPASLLKDIKDRRYTLVIASSQKEAIRRNIQELHLGNESCFDYEYVYAYLETDRLEAWKQMDWDFRGEMMIGGLRFRYMETNRNTPVVLYLHGAGACGNDNRSQVSGLGEFGDALKIMANRYGYGIYAPQCPYSHTWTDADYREGEFVFEADRSQFIDSIADEFIRMYSKRGIRLIGYSIGAYAVWYLITRYPNIFPKALIMAGGGCVSHTNTRIYLMHGARDEIVPVSGSRKMAEIHGDSLYLYREFQETGHELRTEVPARTWMHAFSWLMEK